MHLHTKNVNRSSRKIESTEPGRCLWGPVSALVSALVAFSSGIPWCWALGWALDSWPIKKPRRLKAESGRHPPPPPGRACSHSGMAAGAGAGGAPRFQLSGACRRKAPPSPPPSRRPLTSCHQPSTSAWHSPAVLFSLTSQSPWCHHAESSTFRRNSATWCRHLASGVPPGLLVVDMKAIRP
jgi:hypothetical protein